MDSLAYIKAYNCRVLLTPEPEGGFMAAVATLPGCISYGEKVDECIANAREAIELYIESLEADGVTVSAF